MSSGTKEIDKKPSVCEHASEWLEAPLGDFIRRVVGGGTPSRAVDAYWDGEIAWASVKDLKDDSQFLIDTEEHISAAGLAKSAANLIEAGIPIVATRMAVGRAVRFPRRTAINQDLKALYPNEKLEPTFLVLLLAHIRRQLESLSIGSTVKGIGVDQLLGVKVKVPEPPEQLDVVCVVETANSVVQHTIVLIAKLERVQSGFVQDLLTRGIDEKGNIRNEKTHKFKDSPLGRIPAEWEPGNLKSKGSRSRPYLKTGPFGSSLKGEHWVGEGEGVPVVTIGALGEEKILVNELMYISRQKAKSLIDYALRVGDLVFSRVADVGRSIVIDQDQDGWIMSSNFMRIALDDSLAVPQFLHLNFRYNYAVLQQVRRSVNAGGREVVNSKILNDLVIPWPNRDEQERIVDRFLVMNRRIDAEKEYLTKLLLLRRGLTGDLLTGSVRVNHLLKH